MGYKEGFNNLVHNLSFHYLIIEVYGVFCDGVGLLKARGLSFLYLLHPIYFSSLLFKRAETRATE